LGITRITPGTNKTTRLVDIIGLGDKGDKVDNFPKQEMNFSDDELDQEELRKYETEVMNKQKRIY